MKLPAFQIQIGDLIDLKGDCFADPNGAHTQFESEYVQVVSVEIETADCIAIGFEGFDLVGFPHDHLLNVHGREHSGHADDCASFDCAYDPRPCNCDAG
jgi:hypothetical protein